MSRKFGPSIIAAIWLLAGCSGGENAKQRSVRETQQVSTVTAHVSEVTGRERIPGSVRAATDATIEAKISGRILKIYVHEGEQVKSGQLLFEIDAHEVQAKLDQVLASQKQADQDFKRYQKLLPAGAATQQEYDSALARAKVAEAAVAEAKAMAGYAVIDAPFDGIITRKLADEGDLALPGKPLLSLEKEDLYRFEADLPDSLAAEIQIGSSLSIFLSNLEREIEGTVSEISPVSDPSSRTRRIKIDLPKDGNFSSGEFGYVLAPLKSTPELLVPLDAVVVNGQLESVFVFNGGIADLRLVRSGKRSSNGLQILSGLREGEKVIVGATSILRDGDPVEEKK